MHIGPRRLIRTILELSELVAVFAEPSERRTVKAAARCLNASVSGPPPATSNSWRSSSIDAYVLPEPLVPAKIASPSFLHVAKVSVCQWGHQALSGFDFALGLLAFCLVAREAL